MMNRHTALHRPFTPDQVDAMDLETVAAFLGVGWVDPDRLAALRKYGPTGPETKMVKKVRPTDTPDATAGVADSPA